MLKVLAKPQEVVAEPTVREPQDLIEFSQSALSQHLAEMRKNDFLAITKQGTQVYYHISNPEVAAILSTLYLIHCKDSFFSFYIRITN